MLSDFLKTELDLDETRGQYVVSHRDYQPSVLQGLSARSALAVTTVFPHLLPPDYEEEFDLRGLTPAQAVKVGGLVRQYYRSQGFRLQRTRAFELVLTRAQDAKVVTIKRVTFCPSRIDGVRAFSITVV